MRIATITASVSIAVLALTAMLLPSSADAASYGQLASFGSFGSGDGQFTTPLFVASASGGASAPSGQVFVGDRGVDTTLTDTFRVEEFDLAGAFRRTIVSERGNPASGLLPDVVSGMATDPARGVLYVAMAATGDVGTDHIEKYDLLSGQKQPDLVGDTGALNSPGPIAAEPTTGDVFVAGETGADGEPRMQKYNSGGQTVGSKFGSTGPPDGGATPGQFDSSGIDGLAVRRVPSGQTKVYVLDYRTADPEDDTDIDAPRVQRFSVTGSNWSFDAGSELRSKNETATDVSFTEDQIAADAIGNLYLDLDTTPETPDAVGVIKIAETGGEVFRFGSSGPGDCQFIGAPKALALDASGGLFALDANTQSNGTRRVLRFGSGGTGCGITSTNQAPQAAFTFNPGSPGIGQQVNFNADGSNDPDGTISKYEWDLDGDGSFETDTGTDPHATKSYAQAGTVTVGLRVTDNEAAIGVTTVDVTVTSGPTNAKVVKNKGVLSFVAGDGQDNDLVMTKSNKIVVRDAGASIETVSPCLQGADRHEIKCPSNVRSVNVNAGDGNDRITLRTRTTDVIDGGNGDDVFDAGVRKDGHDTFIGGRGSDTIDFSQRTKKLVVDEDIPKKDGQPGENADVRPDIERIIGGSNNDTLTGGSGAAFDLEGGPGNDVLGGGIGDDVLDGGLGADTFLGGADTDKVTYSDRTTGVVADLDGMSGDDGESGEGDTIGPDVENVEGGSGNDRLTGNGANNMLVGRAGVDKLDGSDGNDMLEAGAGNDSVVGGNGIDTASYADHTLPVKADLDNRPADDGAPKVKEKDTITTDVEGLLGGIGDDRLLGSSGNNLLSGGAGKDKLIGKGGADAITGGLDADNLTGGGGDDFIDARDDGKDLVSCGAGSDTVRADVPDKPPRSCETVL